MTYTLLSNTIHYDAKNANVEVTQNRPAEFSFQYMPSQPPTSHDLHPSEGSAFIEGCIQINPACGQSIQTTYKCIVDASISHLGSEISRQNPEVVMSDIDVMLLHVCLFWLKLMHRSILYQMVVSLSPYSCPTQVERRSNGPFQPEKWIAWRQGTAWYRTRPVL